MDVSPTISNEMKVRYLERRKSDLTTLKEALAKRDFQVFVRIGHTLKGNAQSFGFNELGSIGEALESAGQSGEERSATLALLSFKNWLSDHELSGTT